MRVFLSILILLLAACSGNDDGPDITINNGNNANNANNANNLNNANNVNNVNNANNQNNLNNANNVFDCTDEDGDGNFVDCETYGGATPGPDCDDSDADNWTSCATCVDGDADGWFIDCDQYTAIQGPDCDDNATTAYPGATEILGNNVDDDCDPATPDTCTYVPVPANNPEPDFNAGITAEHNRWRWRVGLAPMTWNSALAASAKSYAEQCIWEHDPNRSPDAGFNYVGENLYATSQQPSVATVVQSVQSWADERADYNFGEQTGQSNGVVGHYTQVVWDDSAEVGCGYARCQNPQGLNFSATIVVCRYGPGGNYTGQTPYDFQNGDCLDLDNDDVWQSADADDTNRNVQ